MKNKILLFTISVASLTSCSTAYKSGQTPDDLYAASGKTERYETETKVTKEVGYEERNIRMAVRDPRWRTLDDRYNYDYSYNPYYYGYNYGYYYNPYYCNYPVYSGGIKFVNPKNTTIRTTNLNTYNNTITTYTPTKGGVNVRTTTVRGYNNSNTREIRNVNVDTRTYTPAPPATNSSTNNNSSSNNSSSNNSNSSSGTSVSRPPRN